MAKLIPLHIHTEYSLLDGAIKVGDLVNYAVANELPAIAITDHGVMYSAIEFYEKRLNIIMKEGELPSELQGRFSYVLQILQMSRTSLDN